MKDPELELSFVYRRNEYDTFQGSILGFPEVIAHGTTIEETEENLKDFLQIVLDEKDIKKRYTVEKAEEIGMEIIEFQLEYKIKPKRYMTINTKILKDKSRSLSLYLRHKPELINITLDKEGWTDVTELLKAVNLELVELNWIVENNDKKRFAFNADKSKIRASQGHSVEVEVDYKIADKIDFLYHGTSIENLESIKKLGLVKGSRTHVHLSKDIETANKVGNRKKGQTIILIIDSLRMRADGIQIYISENNVYLTDFVDVKYIKIMP